jgi:2,4-dienoyl-CoA reductase-like NADH-dependent reductase (Old Yellow Enzyme family)/thioredoxin reductase
MFEKLFAPIKIGRLELKNRLIFSGISPLYATDDGAVTERMIDFMVGRAKGGACLVETGMCHVEVRGKWFINLLGIYDDYLIPGLSELGEAVHKNGAKFGIQLGHVGRFASAKIMGTQPVAPSSIPSPIPFRELPRELTIKEIRDIVEAYGQGARRAKEAGADIIDVICGVGYLVSQFLSPMTNKRRDKYGGDLEGRMRFMLEITERIRQEVGEDYPIMVRLTVDELTEEGYRLDEGKSMAQALEKAGVNLINVLPSRHEVLVPVIQRDVPPGGFAYLAEEIKKVVKVPVAASNRINSPEVAERILSEGKADLITMGRPLIADPELPNKALSGRLDEIRPCISCNQGCFDRLFRGLDTQCLVNPEAGREREYSIKPVEKPKRVLIAGGGPGGMEAARVTALKGHTVTLYEKGEELGGQLKLAMVPPFKVELGSLLNYYTNQLQRLDVKVELGKEVNATLIEELKPHAVIVATGATPLIPEVPGVDQDNVVAAHDVLAGTAKVGARVVVVGGGQVGIETAEFLAEKGKDVTIVEMLKRLGQDIGSTTRWVILHRIAKRGIKTLTNTKVEGIKGNSVLVVKEGENQTLPADTVVISVGVKSDRELWEALKTLQGKVQSYAIGDCVEPRKMFDAIHDGARIARQI